MNPGKRWHRFRIVMSCSMKWKMATAKPTKITRAATTPRHGLEHYCRDLNSWPRSWMGLEKDLPPGKQLVTLFRPFLEHLAMSNLSPKTIQKHVDNMWVLGGELITELARSAAPEAGWPTRSIMDCHRPTTRTMR